MKKKIVAMCATVALATVAIAGGSLAYFTDEDSAENVFTAGNVEIELGEEYEQNSALVPGLKINKDVWVENAGSEESYVRVHLAFPANMDDGDPEFAAYQNFLHWNFDTDAYSDGKWSFLPEYTVGTGYRGNGAGNWNYYETDIDGEKYAVYVATYRTALAPAGENGSVTPNALTQVYMDATVDAESVKDADGKVTGYIYEDSNGNTVELTLEEAKNIKIYVVAEATQVDTFANAYKALNAAFGTPGSYNPFEEPQA